VLATAAPARALGTRSTRAPMLRSSVAAPSQEPVFVVRGLTKTYRMGEVEVPALRSLDLDLRAGELLVLLGASGSGKSTFLNILGGLDTPTSGTVRFLDHDLTRASDAELTRYRREHVGFVFQFYNLMPSLTAAEAAARHRAARGTSGASLVAVGRRWCHQHRALSTAYECVRHTPEQEAL
jgi:predicted ABC-type transport system involved in lysophospholipase L1 biosynthesis ATPase subunit